MLVPVSPKGEDMQTWTRTARRPHVLATVTKYRVRTRFRVT